MGLSPCQGWSLLCDLDWSDPQVPSRVAFEAAPGLCRQQQRCIFSARHQRLVNAAQEKEQGLSICILVCAASVYFLFFNPYFLTVEVLVPTRYYLFIKYVQESARVPIPPSKVGCACPAGTDGGERWFLCLRVGRRRRKEGAEKDRDFKVREQIFTGSKTKKKIYLQCCLGDIGSGA